MFCSKRERLVDADDNVLRDICDFNSFSYDNIHKRKLWGLLNFNNLSIISSFTSLLFSNLKKYISASRFLHDHCKNCAKDLFIILFSILSKCSFIAVISN